MPINKKSNRKPKTKRKVRKKMSRNKAAMIAFVSLMVLSGMIVINAFAQDNGLSEACRIMGGNVYSNDTGTRLCFKE